jgi:exosortase/archaeosortase family protein
VTRLRLRVAAALVLTFGTVWVGFGLLLEPWRRAEAAVVAGTLNALGVNAVRGSYGNLILVVSPGERAFIANISPSCSSLGAVLAFGAFALFLVEGQPLRRLVAFLSASLLITVCNLVRIGMSIWIGVLSDSAGLVLFHDWVGTAFGILFVLMGFMVFLFILLPSNRRIAEGRAHA